MTAKDAKFFNCSEKHEVEHVCGKYEDSDAVREFIRQKAAEGIIKYWTHEKLAAFLTENGFKLKPRPEKMTMAELIGQIHERCGITKADAEKTLGAFIDSIKENLQTGDPVSLPGFGIFKVVEQAGRKGRNPQTGEEMDIPPRKAVKFTPAKLLKEAVAKK